MAEPDPETAFAALEIEAQFALDRPWEPAPAVAARPLLTLGSFPAFGAHRSWAVFDTPGPATISGTRVPSSHSVFFPVIPFSPRCHPWSPHTTTIVFSASPASSRAVRIRPTCESTKLVQAR